MNYKRKKTHSILQALTGIVPMETKEQKEIQKKIYNLTYHPKVSKEYKGFIKDAIKVFRALYKFEKLLKKFLRKKGLEV